MDPTNLDEVTNKESSIEASTTPDANPVTIPNPTPTAATIPTPTPTAATIPTPTPTAATNPPTSTTKEPNRKKKTFKIIVIGDTGVGKTCLTYRFCSGKFPSTPTMLPLELIFVKN